MSLLSQAGMQQIHDDFIPLEVLHLRLFFRKWIYLAVKDSRGDMTTKGTAHDIESAQDAIFWWDGFDVRCHIAGLNSNAIRSECRRQIITRGTKHSKQYLLRCGYDQPKGLKKHGSCR